MEHRPAWIVYGRIVLDGGEVDGVCMRAEMTLSDNQPKIVGVNIRIKYTRNRKMKNKTASLEYYFFCSISLLLNTKYHEILLN